MNLISTLKRIKKIANDNLIENIYIVGGIPRDYSMGFDALKTTDVDLTTNTSDITRLSVLCADYFGTTFKLFDQGNVKVMLKGLNIDFSSNYISENVVNFLKSEECSEYICPAFPDLDGSLLEPYSRDFTINTLHMDLESLEVLDPIGAGLKDLADKTIRTPVPPDITISDDPRRIYRAIYFSSKYNLNVDDIMIKYIKENKRLAKDERVKEAFVLEKISKSLGFDPENTINLLRRMGILGSIPLVGAFKDYIISSKMMLEYLDDEQNYR